MTEESAAKNIGVGINGGQVNVGGDLVGRDKHVHEHIHEAPVPVIAAPFQLPPPPADFTGRKTELRDLRAAIEKGGVHISGLQGQGGVGKTALALKLADELVPNFPDAQIYLDLKGVSEKPLTAAEALSHVLRAFHPQAKLPDKEDDLRALFCSVLHGKRALLLMDNAKDAAQVKSLIPPEGCTLLVTSRFRFTLPGLHQKNLDTLPPDDATKLLLRIAPSIDGEAEAIAKLCGYLALALRLGATAIAERIDLAPAEYRQKLADEKQRLKLLGGNEGVDTSITLSYNLLDAETQKRWRTLSVFPDTFESLAAADVCEIGTDAAKETLGRILQYSMLEWNESTKRYRLHDLMRDFARQRLTSAESAATALHHARHYEAVLATSNDLYLGGGESMMRGLALFDVEWGNIQAGQAWANAHAPGDRDAAGLSSGYPNAGAYCLDLRQHPRERIEWLEAALTAARQQKNRGAEKAHLGNLGVAHFSLGETRHAIEYYEQHLAIAREVGDRKGEGRALGNLSVAYAANGDNRRAIDYHERALVIFREIGDRLAESTALGTVGNAYRALGETRHAIEYHEQHLSMAREIGDRRGEGNALGNLGNAYDSLGEYRRSIDYYMQQLKLTREIGHRQGEGNALWNASLALDKLGDRRKAIELAEASLKIRKQIEDPNAEKVRKRLEQWRRA